MPNKIPLNTYTIFTGKRNEAAEGDEWNEYKYHDLWRFGWILQISAAKQLNQPKFVYEFLERVCVCCDAT